MPTYEVQQLNATRLGPTSITGTPPNAILAQPPLALPVTRTVLLEPNSVGVGGTSSGGGETAVVF